MFDLIGTKNMGTGFTAKCKKTVFLEDDKDTIAFLEGEEYRQNADPELVYPDSRNPVCLIDHQKDNHFMDWKWFHEHFVKL